MFRLITKGIVKSISYRDKLYRQYRTTPTNTDAYDRIKITSNTYNKILKSNIRWQSEITTTHYLKNINIILITHGII